MNIKHSALTLVLILSVLISACSAGAEVGFDGGLDTGLGTGDSGGGSGSQNTVRLDNPLVIFGIVLLIILGLIFGLRSHG
jgi:hypothetical protein